jgi:hypothetical protein
MAEEVEGIDSVCEAIKSIVRVCRTDPDNDIALLAAIDQVQAIPGMTFERYEQIIETLWDVGVRWSDQETAQ